MVSGGCWGVSHKAHGVVRSIHLLSAGSTRNPCWLREVRQCSNVGISSMPLLSWHRGTRLLCLSSFTTRQPQNCPPPMDSVLAGALRLHSQKCTRRIFLSASDNPTAESPEVTAEDDCLITHEDQLSITEQQQEQHEWPHVPVLLNEVATAFEGVKLRTFVDGTVGAAGHTTAVRCQQLLWP